MNTSVRHFLFVAFFLASTLSAEEGQRVDFAHESVPILKEHCIECNGGKKSKGGLSINNRRLFIEGEQSER